MGDLTDSRSMLDQPTYYDHETPGNIRRPKSLYDGSQQVNSVAQVHLYILFVNLNFFKCMHIPSHCTVRLCFNCPLF